MKRGMALLLVLVGCVNAAADHERLGDGLYGKADWSNALGEYRAAARADSTARVLAKLGAAAFHSSNYREAAVAYRALARHDLTRSDEAASGLELVARAADRAGDASALEASLSALRLLAPDRVTGRAAIGLLRRGALRSPDAAQMVPFALAAAPDAGTVDTLLLGYGMALKETTNCEDAAGAFRAALRRSRDRHIRDSAAAGFVECALQLGEEALTVSQPAVAARWFGEAVALDSTSDGGRRALVGLGDARVAQGDLLGAALAFRDAMDPTDPGDSISTLARQRLNGLGFTPGAADTTNPLAP